MEQLDLFESGDLKPIQKWLHVWDEAQRAEEKNRASRVVPTQSAAKPASADGGEGEHQAASNRRAGR